MKSVDASTGSISHRTLRTSVTPCENALRIAVATFLLRQVVFVRAEPQRSQSLVLMCCGRLANDERTLGE